MRNFLVIIAVVLGTFWTGSAAQAQSATDAESSSEQSAPSSAPSVNDIILLRTIGFNEAQILAELDAHEGAARYSEDELAQLREAGFSELFVEHVQSLAPQQTLTNSDIARLIDEGAPVAAILEEIAGADSAFDTSAAAMLTLGQGRSIPMAVTKAMLGAPLTLEDIEMLASADAEETVQLKLIEILGHEVDLTKVSTALELAEAGAPSSVLIALKASDSNRKVQTAEADEAAFAINENDLDRFSHVADVFSFAYPRQWFFSRREGFDGPIYQASMRRPRAGEEAQLLPDGTAITVTAWPRQVISANATISLTEVLESTLSRSFAQQLNDIEPIGEPQETTIGDAKAAYRDYSATIEGEPVGFRWHVALGEEYLIGAMMHTPEAEFAAAESMFEVLIDAVNVETRKLARREENRSYSSSELAGKYREAVVNIVVGDEYGKWVGSGTGFFIRRDGYLLTNQHVIFNKEANRPFRYFNIQWSSELDIEDEDAELVDFVRHQSEIGGFNIGEDLALLRVSGIGDFDTIPLTPLDHTDVGDPIITIGYPITEQFDRRPSTTISSGLVTRFNRDADDRIDTIVTDAKIAPGNSGGPAVSLVTGGVVGLNTQIVSQLASTSENPSVREAVGYAGIMPIDRAIERYPQQTMVRAARDQRLDANDAFDLALFADQQDWRAGAIDLAAKAVQRAPSSAASHHLYAKTLLAPHPERTEEDLIKGQRELDLALAIDPSYQAALFTKADHEIDREEFLEAIKAVNAAIEVEETWPAYTKRARIYSLMEQYEDALSDLHRAKELSQDQTVEPYLIAGEIRYLQEEYDEGRAEYEKALEIAPTNIQARLGLGQYYLNVEKYLAALLEFDSIAEDEPKNPDARAAIGSTYARQGDYDKAVDNFVEAVNLYYAAKITPPEEMLSEAAEVAADKLLDKDDGRRLYALYLGLYYDSRETLNGHRYLATQFKERDAVERAHLTRAIELKGNTQDDERAELEDQLEDVQNAVLDLDDVRAMWRRDYPSSLIVRIIKDNPGNFSIAGRTAADNTVDDARSQALAKLREEFGTDVMIAIYLKVRNRERGVEQGGDNNRQVDQQDDNDRTVSLVGTWFRERDNRRVEIELAGNRDFKITDIRGGRANVLRQGNWELEQVNETYLLALGYNTDDGQQTSKLPLRVEQHEDGDRLFLTQNEQEYEYQRAAGG